ncbi:uncharacterized protein LOC142236348 isoform X2 [Haematobia irritans]|uniref:uncharacterized protein LOC142236348 isoform X2 n=1 Tax=Haematobia irritans TaxID=7368 RepID=UPI003F4F867D
MNSSDATYCPDAETMMQNASMDASQTLRRSVRLSQRPRIRYMYTKRKGNSKCSKHSSVLNMQHNITNTPPIGISKPILKERPQDNDLVLLQKEYNMLVSHSNVDTNEVTCTQANEFTCTQALFTIADIIEDEERTVSMKMPNNIHSLNKKRRHGIDLSQKLSAIPKTTRVELTEEPDIDRIQYQKPVELELPEYNGPIGPKTMRRKIRAKMSNKSTKKPKEVFKSKRKTQAINSGLKSYNLSDNVWLKDIPLDLTMKKSEMLSSITQRTEKLNLNDITLSIETISNMANTDQGGSLIDNMREVVLNGSNQLGHTEKKIEHISDKKIKRKSLKLLNKSTIQNLSNNIGTVKFQKPTIKNNYSENSKSLFLDETKMEISPSVKKRKMTQNYKIATEEERPSRILKTPWNIGNKEGNSSTQNKTGIHIKEESFGYTKMQRATRNDMEKIKRNEFYGGSMLPDIYPPHFKYQLPPEVVLTQPSTMAKPNSFTPEQAFSFDLKDSSSTSPSLTESLRETFDTDDVRNLLSIEKSSYRLYDYHVQALAIILNINENYLNEIFNKVLNISPTALRKVSKAVKTPFVQDQDIFEIQNSLENSPSDNEIIPCSQRVYGNSRLKSLKSENNP